MAEFLPYSRQVIDDDDIAAVTKVLKSDFLTTGPETPAFEEALQQKMQVKHAITVNSGTAALHLAWRILELQKNDKVIVPAITFLSAATMAILAGAELIFADCDPDTGLMTADTIAKAAMNAAGDDETIKAICVVHLNGQFADMASIKHLADARGWRIIEDACHAMGGLQLGNDGQDYPQHYPVGACHYSDITVFSLHAVKNITTGEGGIITCNHDEWAVKMRDWRSHGIIRERLNYQASKEDSLWYHEMHEWGMNYRMSDIQAALGHSQLKKLKKFIEARAEIFALYQQKLADFPQTIRLIRQTETGIPAWHLAVVLIDFEALATNRGAFMQALRDQQIGTQLHYMPIYRHSYFAGNQHQPLQGAEQYSARALSLPIFYGMKEADVTRVTDALKGLIDG